MLVSVASSKNSTNDPKHYIPSSRGPRSEILDEGGEKRDNDNSSSEEKNLGQASTQDAATLAGVQEEWRSGGYASRLTLRACTRVDKWEVLTTRRQTLGVAVSPKTPAGRSGTSFLIWSVKALRDASASAGTCGRNGMERTGQGKPQKPPPLVSARH